MGSDAVPDCAMTYPVVNHGAACTLSGVCARLRHFRLTDVHPHAQKGLAADIRATRCEPDRSNLAGLTQPETSAIHLVRGAGDLKAAMPRFVTALIEAQMSTQQEGRHPS